MGNICRSPLAEGVLTRQVVDAGLQHQITVDSAGTHAHHAGEAPDPRGITVAAKRGYTDLKQQRSRLVKPEDFEKFDLIVAMDRDNLAHLKRQCSAEHAHKLHLLLEFAPQLGLDEVPDPYYGNLAGFERVLDLCEAGVSGLLAHVRSQQSVPMR